MLQCGRKRHLIGMQKKGSSDIQEMGCSESIWRHFFSRRIEHTYIAPLYCDEIEAKPYVKRGIGNLGRIYDWRYIETTGAVGLTESGADSLAT